jgi:hypothetical protein
MCIANESDYVGGLIGKPLPSYENPLRNGNDQDIARRRKEDITGHLPAN